MFTLNSKDLGIKIQSNPISQQSTPLPRMWEIRMMKDRKIERVWENIRYFPSGQSTIIGQVDFSHELIIIHMPTKPRPKISKCRSMAMSSLPLFIALQEFSCQKRNLFPFNALPLVHGRVVDFCKMLHSRFLVHRGLSPLPHHPSKVWNLNHVSQ
mgnify:FL=1